MDGRTHRQTDRQTDRQADRQTDEHEEAKSCLSYFVNTPKNSNSNLIQLLGKAKESGNNIFFSLYYVKQEKYEKSIPVKNCIY